MPGTGGPPAARRPSRLDSEDLSKSGGWTRDASGHLVPPPPKPKPEPEPPTPPAPVKAPAKQAPAKRRNARSRPRSRSGSRNTGPRIVGGVRAPGTAGGVLLALITYPVFVAWLRGGTPAARAWFNAKFLNKTATADKPAGGVSGTPGTKGFAGNGNTGTQSGPARPGQPYYPPPGATGPNGQPYGVGTGA